MYTIEKCYLLIEKNKKPYKSSHYLSEYSLSVSELYHKFSWLLFNSNIIEKFNELFEIICVKLIIEDEDKNIISITELKRYSIKEIESSLIPF